jgi:hypothetical protein
MAVVVGVTEHLLPCRRRGADEGKRLETRSAGQTGSPLRALDQPEKGDEDDRAYDRGDDRSD